MSEQVLLRPLSRLLPSLWLNREARQRGATHGRLVQFRGRTYAQLARQQTPDYLLVLLPLVQQDAGIVIGPAHDREQWVVFAWQGTNILCLRVTSDTEAEATLEVLALQPSFQPTAIIFLRFAASEKISELFPRAQIQVKDSDWARQLTDLPSIRHSRFAPMALIIATGLSIPFAITYMTPEPEPLITQESDEQSIDHQLEQANGSVVDLLRHHQVLIEQLTGLAGWGVQQVAWTGSGFLVELQQHSGDLHDLHLFTHGSVMQLQVTERGRALFWPVHLLPVAEHANLSLMATMNQGDWLEDLIRNGLPSIQVQRDFAPIASGSGWHAQRMVLRFQNASAVDLYQLNQVLYPHPVRLVQFQYRQQSPDNVYLGYQGQLTFDYFGVSL